MGMAIALVLAAAQGSAAAPAVETIRYSVGPCHGTCPVYSVTVSADGRGTFEGERFTAMAGRRSFRVSRTAYAAFRRRLIADRPVGTVDLDTPAACRAFATDHPTITVRWSGGAWGRRHGTTELRYNTGCDLGDGGRRRRALQAAPQALPIARLVEAAPSPR